MLSYNRRKYPAFGSYLGGASGTLVGGLVGNALAQANKAGRRQGGAATALGMALGGALGVPAGALAGKLWSKLRENANKRKAEKQLLAAMKNPELATIRQRLLQLRAEEEKAKKKTKKS